MSEIPGYQAGTWNIDPSHSEVGFTVRHVMVTKVRGRFEQFEGKIVTGERPEDSSVTASINLASVNTGTEQRDNHLRSTDFFNVEKNEQMTYRSTSITADGSDWKVEGELSLNGITKNVPLKLEVNGVGPDPWGGTRIGFTATTELSRKDFGIDFQVPMEGNGVVIGDKVTVNLEIQAVLENAQVPAGV